MTRPNRLLWVDQLRAVLTVLVVGHHAAQAYGPTGGSWPIASAVRAPILGVFIAVNAMYFMSLFFFLAGYFVPGTYARKGARAFLRDRLWRLGIPSLTVWLLTGLLMDRPQFLHLWFVIDLLALNIGYVAWERWRARPGVDVPSGDAMEIQPAAAPDGAWRGLFLLLAMLTLGTAVIRLRFPVDAWIDLFGVLPIEPAHAVHYLAAFIGGIVAARARWLERAHDPFGRALFALALLVVTLYACYRLVPPAGRGWFAGGGVSWATLRLAGLESIVCVTMGGGLLWLFRTSRRVPSRLLGALADDAFGIYCIHLPLVIAAQFAIADLALGPMLKFLIATTAALTASWIITRQVLRRWAFGRRIF